MSDDVGEQWIMKFDIAASEQGTKAIKVPLLLC